MKVSLELVVNIPRSVYHSGTSFLFSFSPQSIILLSLLFWSVTNEGVTGTSRQCSFLVSRQTAEPHFYFPAAKYGCCCCCCCCWPVSNEGVTEASLVVYIPHSWYQSGTSFFFFFFFFHKVRLLLLLVCSCVCFSEKQ